MPRIGLAAALALLLAAACNGQVVRATSPGTVSGAPHGRVFGPYVPAGTETTLALGHELSAGASASGEPFTATVESPLVADDGRVLVPSGATVWGHVVGAGAGLHPRLVLDFDAVQTQLGPAPFIAKVLDVHGEREPAAREERRLLASPPVPVAPEGIAFGPPYAGAGDVVLPAGTRLRVQLTRPLYPPGTVFGR